MTVVKLPLGEFRAKAILSFLAPRAEVMTQTCRNIKYKSFDSTPLIAGTDNNFLEAAGITIDPKDFSSCHQYLGGRKIRVLIPHDEHDPTYVLLYHVPSR